MPDAATLARWLDPEIRAYVARCDSLFPEAAAAPSPAESRVFYDRLAAAFRAPRPPGLAVRDAPPLRRYRPAAMRHAAVLLFVHGGGFVLGGLESHDDICADLAAGAGLEVVAVDYRLAPDHPWPAALDDVQAAYAVLRAEGRPVVVGGDSAGGNLAAALCHRLHRLGEPPPRGQLLIYAGLSANPLRVAGRREADAPMLTARECVHFLRLYAGTADPTGNPELAPLEATDFAGLPPAALFAAGYDPVRQDMEDYAAALLAAGQPVRYRADPGLVHGWLRARHSARLAAAAFTAVVEAAGALAAGAITA
ncbi:MAG: alpha/beta hydrolase [Alphaproteobacteria bacterium]|nr:alpha/beta hydrolase [Alphaproteobacteria bacterium]